MTKPNYENWTISIHYTIFMSITLMFMGEIYIIALITSFLFTVNQAMNASLFFVEFYYLLLD